MRVIVGCEFSGAVRRAFRARGHDAWSCDLPPAEDGDPHHHQMDILTLLLLQPWMFGHGEQKRTGLWLRGLPLLTPTDVVEGRAIWVENRPRADSDRWAHRSRTYEGIAQAMAEQWG